MTRWLILAGLIVLNGILAVGVYQRGLERRADAQMAGAGPDLVTIVGNAGGQTVVYTLDANTGILVARRLDITNQKFDPPIRREVTVDLRKIQ
jgi:hypothetical protein